MTKPQPKFVSASQISNSQILNPGTAAALEILQKYEEIWLLGYVRREAPPATSSDGNDARSCETTTNR